MGRKVFTGCRDCKKCMNSGAANAGRNMGRLLAAASTAGLSEAGLATRKKCRICDHQLSLHGQDPMAAAAPAVPRQSLAERLEQNRQQREETHDAAVAHVEAYLAGEYPKWKLTGRELLLLRKANKEREGN